MRYLTIYGKYESARKGLRLISNLFMLTPFIILGVALYVFLTDRSQVNRDMIIGVSLSSLSLFIAYFVMRWKFNQLVNTVIEMNDIGIQDLTPGKEKLLRWADLTEAKWIQQDKNQKALQLKTATDKMVIWQQLVPDLNDGTLFKSTFNGIKLIYPDGREEKIKLENSFPVRELTKYRPDLAIKLSRPFSLFRNR